MYFVPEIEKKNCTGSGRKYKKNIRLPEIEEKIKSIFFFSIYKRSTKTVLIFHLIKFTKTAKNRDSQKAVREHLA